MKQETRDKFLDSSCAIAKKSGFDTTGVDALMGAIGVSGGAVYRHFDSKAELFAAMLERELDLSRDMLGGNGDFPPDHVAKRLRGYLSQCACRQPRDGVRALGPEIARRAGSHDDRRALAQAASALLGRGPWRR